MITFFERAIGIVLVGYLLFCLVDLAMTSPLGLFVGLNALAVLMLFSDCGYRSSAAAGPFDPH